MTKIFEWDFKKNLINKRKHFISFEEAVTIFANPIVAKNCNDTSLKEQKNISIGRTLNNDIIISCIHSKKENKIKIISARKASKQEREIYLNYLNSNINND